MRVLSIDPGYEKLGLAILEMSGTENSSLVYSECFRTPKTDFHSERLSKIAKKILVIINEFSPNDLAIEKLFFNKNQKTALLVAEARGLIIGLSRANGLNVFEYSPQEIKMAVCGNGRSDKNSVIKMVSILIGDSNKFKNNSFNNQKLKDKNIKIKKTYQDDEYDAIACGLTHRAISRFN